VTERLAFHELLLNKAMCKLTVKAIPIGLGQKEIEESVIRELGPRFNTDRSRNT